MSHGMSQTSATIRDSSNGESRDSGSPETSASSTSTKRKQDRENLNLPKSRKKPKRKTKPTADDLDNGQAALDAVARATRWMVLLHFSRNNWVNIIKEVYGEELQPDSATYNFARGQIFDHCRQYKCKVMRDTKAHVARLIEVDEQEDGHMYASADVRTLNRYFIKAFGDGENFLSCFSFMSGYIDIPKSSPLGKYYLSNVYANLATQMKLYIDLCRNGEPGRRDAWEEISRFYNKMALHSHFDNVDKHQFKALSDRYARSKTVQKPNEISPDDDPRYVVSGAPPPPAAAAAV